MVGVQRPGAVAALVAPRRQLPRIAVLARVASVRVLPWLGVVHVIGLGMPAGREIGSQRTVDESGNGDGVRPAGVPLQSEWHELAGRHRLDDGAGVGCGQGRAEVVAVRASMGLSEGGPVCGFAY